MTNANHAALFEGLRPNYAWAQQVAKDDARIQTSYETVASPKGNGSIKGYLARPKTITAKLPVVLVIHEIEGKPDGLAYRVPTPTVSIVEIVALTERDTTKEEVNRLLAETAGEKMKGILGFTTDPVVSMDMKGDERSSIVDGLSTNVVGGNLVKVAAWYDNEWGYACRISDLCSFLVDKGI